MTGAVQCLREKGYARTTARDVTSIAGTSLAAIGYHFGSTQNLLNEAAKSLLERWATNRAQVCEETRNAADPEARLLAFFSNVIQHFTEDRQLAKSILDMMLQVDHVREVREFALAKLKPAIAEYVAAFEDTAPESVDEHQIRTIGSVYLAMFHGLMLQYVLDPEQAPKATEFLEGLRGIAQQYAVGAK